MNRVRVALVAAGMAAMLVAGVALGGALDVAHAEGPIIEPTPGGPSLAIPTLSDGTNGAGGVPDWVLDAWSERFGADSGDAEADSATAETVQCSIVTGCTIEVVDAEGTVIKVMEITFTDVGEVDAIE